MSTNNNNNNNKYEAINNTSEEEILRKRLKPDPTVEEVIDVIRTYYFNGKSKDKDGEENGVDIKLIKELDSYDDCNLWISVNGKDYLAKVHNGVESRDMIQFLKKDTHQKKDHLKSAIHLQNAIMIHLNNCGITTNQPQIPTTTTTIMNSNSNPTMPPVVVVPLPVVSSEDSPTPLVVRLLGWVGGRTMSSFPMLPIEGLADAGRFLGNLSHSLSSMQDNNDIDASKRYHQWDGKNTADLKDFVKYVTDDRKQSMIESVIQTFQTNILDTNVGETSFEKSIIHGDFNDANFLLNDNLQVSGVIDFGDSVESWTILDLSIALAYCMMNSYGKRRRSLSAAASFLRGYNSVRQLSKDERLHLPLLIACRLSCSATLGAYSYAQNPGNEYLLLHAKPAWKALDLIWGTDPERRTVVHKCIHELFDLACSSSGDGGGKEVIDCSDLAFSDPNVPDPIAALRNNLSD